MVRVIDPQLLTFDIADTWQARGLVAAQGKTYEVLLSVLAHNYDDAMPVLLEVVYPGFRSITAPFLCTAGRVDKTGAVVANRVGKTGAIHKDFVLYRNEVALRDDFRRLADRLKLADHERREMFVCVQRWVVADRRLDPNMDPKDSDAKRLTVH